MSRSEDELWALSPEELHDLVQSGTDNVELTFAAEYLGHKGYKPAIPALVALLAHSAPLVREGALMGLGCFDYDDDMYDRVERLAQRDPSPGVRGAAEDTLAVWDLIEKDS